MKGLKGEKQNTEINKVCNMEPVMLLKNRSDMIYGGSSGNHTCSRILIQLDFVKTLQIKTKRG